MSGWWWLKAKTYLRDMREPTWVNRDACVPPLSGRFNADYQDTYVGEDRSLPLIGRPHFDLEHREGRPLDLRSLAPDYRSALDPCFLVSRELAELIQSIDAEVLHVAECDVSSHGRAPHAVCLMADTRLCVHAWDTLDRVRSEIEIKPGFAHDTGEPFRAVEIRGVVHFKAEAVADRAIVRLVSGPRTTRVCISDKLADAIFARELLGVELEDASGDRKAPARYGLYKTSGWEGAYPA